MCDADETTLAKNLTLAEQQREGWKRAAKGGSWLRRAGRTALDVGVVLMIGRLSARF